MSEKKPRKKRGERKDGRIQVTYTDGYKADGKPNRLSFYGYSRAEAERKRDEYRLRGKAMFLGDDITLAEWIEQFKMTYRPNVNPAYLNIDDVPYNRLRDNLGHMVLSSVREADLQNELNQLAGMSYSTIDKYYQAIKRVFLRALKNGLIRSNPASDLIVPVGNKGTHRALERWEIDCILKNWHLHRAGIWAMLMMLAGLRRSEVMALRWENVDMGARQITVCEVAVITKNQTKVEARTKSKAGLRVIPICKPLWDALNQTQPDERHGLICTSANGTASTESSFVRGWQGFCTAMQRCMNNEPIVQSGRRISLEKRIKDAEKKGQTYTVFSVRAHDLRHTFATALFDAGVPAKAAQYYLGHADIRMTLELYTHLSQEKEKATSSQITGFLDGWLKLGLDGQKNDHEAP